MFYSIIVRKNNGQNPHPFLDVVRDYINNFGTDDILVCFPGFMSFSSTSLKNFHDNYPLDTKSVPNQNRCIFFEGMNGYRIVSGTASIAQDYLNNLYGQSSPSVFQTGEDHSKVVFFVDGTKKYKDSDDLIQKILHGLVKIKALSVGSSNLSDNTMTKSPISAKGETDLLLVDFDPTDLLDIEEKLLVIFDHKKQGEDYNPVMVSKQISVNDPNYLLNIFIDMIQNDDNNK